MKQAVNPLPFVALAAVVVLGIGGVAVYAATSSLNGNTALLTNSDTHIPAGVAASSPLDTEGRNNELKSPMKSEIIDVDNLPEGFLCNSISSIALEDEQIPAFVFGNGDLVILTKPGQTGWKLGKGEMMTIHFSLDLERVEGADKENGEYIGIGVIKDGAILEEPDTGKKKEFLKEFTAGDDGEYYFYVENFSAGLVVIDNCIIN